MRFRDVLAETPLATRLAMITDEASVSWLRELGKNDLQHSQAVEQLLDRLVPDELKMQRRSFDLGEIFLLLAAVYLHDIGRSTDAYHHEIEAYNRIRANPRDFFLKNEHEAEAVAQICAAHAPENVWPIQRCDANYGIAGLTSEGRTFDLQCMGALLRIADELDNSYVRVDGIVSQSKSIRAVVRDVNPLPSKGVIEIQANPRSWKDWSSLKAMRENTQRRLREVGEYLEKLGLSYYQIWLRPSKFEAPLRIPEPTSTYHDMVEKVALLVQPRFERVDVLAKLCGCEVSVLCTSTRIGRPLCTAILVAPQLTTEVAMEYAGALLSLKDGGKVVDGFVVTGDVHSAPDERQTAERAEAKQCLTAQGIDVLTYEDLQAQLYDFSPAMRAYIRDLEKEELFRRGLFIHPQCSLTDGTETIDALAYVHEWLKTPAAIHLTVLGDYGSGKTTLARRLVYDLAHSYLKNPREERIPIILSLKNVRQAESIEAAITDVLVNQLGQDITYDAFEFLNTSGRLVLILDGFDELAGLHDEATTLRAFRQLDRLVAENAKVILTCRTHFFKDAQQVRSVHDDSPLFASIESKYGYQLLYLEPFTDAQVREYLLRWEPVLGAQIYETISTVYNLSDLARRPVLLHLLAKTVPQMDMAVAGTHLRVDASTLYQMYMGFWLERDDWRSQLTSSDRLTIAQTIAEFLLVSRRPAIHHAELADLLPAWFSEILSKYGHGVLDVECRTCNFLVSDRAGNYSFAHKSFQEYLLAQMYVEALFAATREEMLFQWRLPSESQRPVRADVAVTPETETFVLQLAARRLDYMSPHALYALVNGRSRASSAIVRMLEQLRLHMYGEFCAEALVRGGVNTPPETLVRLLVHSTEPEKALYAMLSMLDETSDLYRAEKTLQLMRTEAGPQLATALQRLQQRISELAPRIDGAVGQAVDGGQYPFSRAERERQLAEELAGCDDPEAKADARKRFLRKWSRAKAEYDQRQKRERRGEHAEDVDLDDTGR